MTSAWDRVALRVRIPKRSIDSPMYSPVGPDDRDLRLVGDIKNKRVLDLGCGTGQAAMSFANSGAVVIAIDSSAEQLRVARELSEESDIRIEWHQRDVADLAMIRADSIDVAWSAFVLSEVADLDRWFRQVHRVIKQNGSFIFSYEHPFAMATARNEIGVSGGLAKGSLVVNRPYRDEEPIIVDLDGEPMTVYPRTIETVMTSLYRAGFRVDNIAEPLATEPGNVTGSQAFSSANPTPSLHSPTSQSDSVAPSRGSTPSNHGSAVMSSALPSCIIWRARKL